MKKQNWVWTMSALAVMASPLTLDHLVGKLGHEQIYRSIASQESVDKFPHLTRAQDEQLKVETPAQAQEKRITVVNIVKLTLNDPELLKKLNNDINAEKKKGEELKLQLKAAQDQLAITESSLKDANEKDNAKAEQVQNLEKEVETHVAQIAMLDSVVSGLEESSNISKQQLEDTKIALEAAKLSADEASQALSETQTKLAESIEAIATKDEELNTKSEEIAKKEEELKLKNEELAKSELALKERTAALDEQKATHDLYVCKSEEKFVVLGKQLEDLNLQQQQFTQAMMGLNQALIGLFTQMQNMNNNQQQVQGMNYFGQAYMPNPYATGQLQSPTAVISGNYPFNPWMQQQNQQPIINNYYGPAGMMNQGQPGLMPQSQYYMPYQDQNPLPGGYDFGMPGMNDGSRAVFGAFGQTGQPNMQQMMPQMMLQTMPQTMQAPAPMTQMAM
jgi:chromosome segregation ATPase